MNIDLYDILEIYIFICLWIVITGNIYLDMNSDDLFMLMWKIYIDVYLMMIRFIWIPHLLVINSHLKQWPWPWLP